MLKLVNPTCFLLPSDWHVLLHWHDTRDGGEAGKHVHLPHKVRVLLRVSRCREHSYYYFCQQSALGASHMPLLLC